MLKQGQHAQALEKVDSYLSSRPKDAQGRFMKGLILTEMNRTADAISVFTRLSEDYPELPEPYNNLAVLYAQQKQYDKARTALEMAIRTHPSYAIAYENLGDIYSKLASQAYDKALQFDGANSATKSKLAMIHNMITTSSKTTPGRPPLQPLPRPLPPSPALRQPLLLRLPHPPRPSRQRRPVPPSWQRHLATRPRRAAQQRQPPLCRRHPRRCASHHTSPGSDSQRSQANTTSRQHPCQERAQCGQC
jgi:hypothetical protein